MTRCAARCARWGRSRPTNTWSCSRRWAGEKAPGEDGATGVVFAAEIHKLGAMPDFEMAETRAFDALPPLTQLTYPGITPELFGQIGRK